MAILPVLVIVVATFERHPPGEAMTTTQNLVAGRPDRQARSLENKLGPVALQTRHRHPEHATVHSVATVSIADCESQSALRLAAIGADAKAKTEINLSLLWRELVRGASNVVDSFFSDEQCYLLLSAKTDGPPTPVEGRRLEILE